MSGHQTATINDTVFFWFASNDTSGSGGDGATPLFDVREAGAAASAAPLLSGTPTLLSNAAYPAGCHEISVAATTGNGFAADDTFAVFCTIAIDSQNPSGFVGSCTLTPLAKAAALATAQTDLDTITGAAGALIDDGTGAGQIALTAGAIDNVTLVATTTVSTDAEADIAALNDVAATDIVSAGAIATLSGAIVNVDLVDTTTDVTNQVTADVTSISGDTPAANNLEADYDGTGFTKAASTIGTCTTNTDMRGTDSALLAANINLSSGVVESNLLQMGGIVQSGTDLKDFADEGYDPATNKVQGVVLVDTTTVNSDMRGTDGVDTATMRGTDSALLASDDGSGLVEAGGTGDQLTAIDLPNQTMDITGNITGNLSGSVGSVTGNVDGNVTGSVGSNLELGPSEVNAEVVDVFFTDTDAEPVKGAPGATISIADKIGFLYKAWRNRSTQTATVYSVFNDDATTVDHDATVSDDTTTADRGEMTDGP